MKVGFALEGFVFLELMHQCREIWHGRFARYQLAASPASTGLVEQSHADNQRLQYLPHEAKVAIEVVVSDGAAAVLHGFPERMAAPDDMPLGVLLSSALLRAVDAQSAVEPPQIEECEVYCRRML